MPVDSLEGWEPYDPEEAQVPAQAQAQAPVMSSEPLSSGGWEPVSSGGVGAYDPKTHATEVAQRHGFRPEVFHGLINAESAWNPKALGPVTKYGQARGLTQMIPATAKAMGATDPFDPHQSIEGGGKYFKQQLDRFNGDYPRALAAYNWGPENAAKWDGDWNTLPKETRIYLGKILGVQQVPEEAPGYPKTLGRYMQKYGQKVVDTFTPPIDLGRPGAYEVADLQEEAPEYPQNLGNYMQRFVGQVTGPDINLPQPGVSELPADKFPDQGFIPGVIGSINAAANTPTPWPGWDSSNRLKSAGAISSMASTGIAKAMWKLNPLVWGYGGTKLLTDEVTRALKESTLSPEQQIARHDIDSPQYIPTVDPVIENLRGFADFTGRPLGLSGLDVAKESWKNEPVDSLIATLGLLLGGAAARKKSKRDLTPTEQVKLAKDFADLKTQELEGVEKAKAETEASKTVVSGESTKTGQWEPVVPFETPTEPPASEAAPPMPKTVEQTIADAIGGPDSEASTGPATPTAELARAANERRTRAATYFDNLIEDNGGRAEAAVDVAKRKFGLEYTAVREGDFWHLRRGREPWTGEIEGEKPFNIAVADNKLSQEKATDAVVESTNVKEIIDTIIKSTGLPAGEVEQAVREIVVNAPDKIVEAPIVAKNPMDFTGSKKTTSIGRSVIEAMQNGEVIQKNAEKTGWEIGGKPIDEHTLAALLKQKGGKPGVVEWIHATGRYELTKEWQTERAVRTEDQWAVPEEKPLEVFDSQLEALNRARELGAETGQSYRPEKRDGQWGLYEGEIELENNSETRISAIKDILDNERGAAPILQDVARAVDKQSRLWASKMREVFAKDLPGKFTASEFDNLVQTYMKKGKFKPEEWADTIRMTNLNAWLGGKEDRKITKQEFLDWIDLNGIKVEEVKRGALFNNPEYMRYDKQITSLYDKKLDLYDKLESVSTPTEIHNIRAELNAIDAERIVLADEQQKLVKSLDPPIYERSNQVLPGGKEYVELILTSPQAGKLPHDSSHFVEGKGERQIGWIRGKVFIDAQGRKIFHIEEVQSKRHQAGNKEGYAELIPKEVYVERNDISNKLNDIAIKLQDARLINQHKIIEKTRELYTERYKDGVSDSGVNVTELRRRIAKRLARKEAEVKLFPDIEELLKSERELRDRAGILDDIINKARGTPDAPFRKTWPTLLLKRALKYAAENGYDGVSWTTGEQQIARNNTPLERIKYVRENADGSVTVSIGDRSENFSPSKELPPGSPEIAEIKQLLGDRADKITEGIDLSQQPLEIGGKFHKKLYGSMSKEGTWTGGILSRAMRDATSGMDVREEMVRASGTTLPGDTLADSAYRDGILTEEEYLKYKQEGIMQDLATVTPPSTKHFSTQPGIIFTPEMKGTLVEKPMYMYTFPGPLGEMGKQLVKAGKDLVEARKDPMGYFWSMRTKATDALREKHFYAGPSSPTSDIYKGSVEREARRYSAEQLGVLESQFLMEDIAKKVPVEDRINFHSVREGTSAHKLSPIGQQFYDNAVQLMDYYRKALQKYGRLEEFIQDYFPHIVYENPEGQKVDLVRFLKGREDPLSTLDALKKAGYKVETDAAVWIPTYLMWAEKTLGRLEFLRDTKKTLDPSDGLPIIRPSKLVTAEQKANHEYKMYNYGHRLKAWNSDVKYGDPVLNAEMKKMFESDIYVHKDILQTLDGLFTDPLDASMNLLGHTQSKIKQIRMYNPLFHGWNIATQLLAGLGKDSLKMLPWFRPEMMQTEAGLREVMRRFVGAGGNLEGLYDVRRRLGADQYKERLSLEPFKPQDLITNPSQMFTHPFKTAGDLNNYILFDKMLKTSQLVTFLVKYDRYMNPSWAAENLGRVKPLGEMEAAKLAAIDANNVLGTLQPYTFTKNQRDWLRHIMFARNWNVSTTRQLTGALLSGEKSQAVLPKFLRTEGLNEKQWKALGWENRAYVARLVLGAVTSAHMLQAAMQTANGVPVTSPFQNEEGHKLDIDTGLLDANKNKIYLRNFLYRQVEDAYRGWNSGFMKMLMGKVEPLAKATGEWALNVDYKGKPIHGEEAGLEGIKENAKAFIKHFSKILPYEDVTGREGRVDTWIDTLAPLVGSSTRHGSGQTTALANISQDFYRWGGRHDHLSKEAMSDLKILVQQGKNNEAAEKLVGYIMNRDVDPGQYKFLMKSLAAPFYQKIIKHQNFKKYLMSKSPEEQERIMKTIGEELRAIGQKNK